MTRPLRFFGVETGARMTVVRLRGGGLFVHSPVPLADDVRAAVEVLGPVEAVVAPSLFHHLSVNEWRNAFPDAVFACCPGLEKKRDDVPWDRILTDAPEPEWAGDLEQVFFAARTMENEVVFFHTSTRTMICADAIFNLCAHANRATRLVALLLGNRKPGATWLERIMIRDRAGAREQIGRMLAWRPDRILLAHGPSIEEDGEAALRRAYAWL
jgi:hypothetical protein